MNKSEFQQATAARFREQDSERSIRSSIVDLLKLVGLPHSMTHDSLVLMTLGIISPLTRGKEKAKHFNAQPFYYLLR